MQIIDNIPEFRREPIVVLLLGFITCGLYTYLLEPTGSKSI